MTCPPPHSTTLDSSATQINRLQQRKTQLQFLFASLITVSKHQRNALCRKSFTGLKLLQSTATLAASFINIQTFFRRTVMTKVIKRHKSQGTGRRLTMLYVKTKPAVSQNVHQTVRPFQFLMLFILCNETTSHPDDHFASLSWKEILPSFQSLGKGLRVLVSACSLANNLLCN